MIFWLFSDNLKHKWFEHTVHLVHEPDFVLLASFGPQHLELFN